MCGCQKLGLRPYVCIVYLQESVAGRKRNNHKISLLSVLHNKMYLLLNNCTDLQADGEGEEGNRGEHIVSALLFIQVSNHLLQQRKEQNRQHTKNKGKKRKKKVGFISHGENN